MLIPRLFYGTAREVKAQVKPLVKTLRRAERLDKLNFGEMIDTGEILGSRILLAGGQSDFDGKHFHATSFFEAVLDSSVKELNESVLESCFAWSLSNPWRYLGVLGQSGSLFLYPIKYAVWRKPFLEAALTHLNVLELEGPRYGLSPRRQSRFSQTPTSILPTIAKTGVRLRPQLEELSESKLRSLIEMALERIERNAC